MTTRLYLDPYNGSPLYVGPHIGWDVTDSMVTSLLLTQEQSVDGSPTACWLSLDDSYGTAPKSSAGIQFISKPLKPQTISGTFKGQFRAAQDGVGQGFCRAITVRVMSGDGSVERGTLLQHIPPSLISEFATTLTNRNFPPSLSLTEVVVQDGDVLVIEIGAVCFSDLSNYPSGQIEAFNGDASLNDLPEDEITTDIYNSWFEFSQTIEFQPPSFLHESLIGLCLKPTAFWPPAGRLFFGSTYINPPEISPAFSTSWDVTDGATRASFAKISDTNTWPEGAGNQASQSATSQKVLIRQYISSPLAAQSITGTVNGQILAHENQNYYECSRAVIIRVFSGDGLTERGVVLSDIPTALESEFILGVDAFSPFENRNFPPVSPVTEVQVQEGDVLVVEVGFRSFNTAGTAAAELMFIYNFINAQDLPIDESTLFDYYAAPYTEYNTWLQFSNPLVFQGEGAESFSHEGNIALSLTPSNGTGEPLSFTHEGHATLTLVPSNFPVGPVTSLVAAGSISVGGNESSYDTITPEITAFAAVGSLSLCGSCVLNIPAIPVSRFAAAGFLGLGCAGQTTGAFPSPPPQSDFAASGFLSLTGACRMDFISPPVNDFAAAGSLRLGGPILSQMEVIYPASLVSAFAAAGGLNITGVSIMDSPSPLVTAFVANTGLGAPVLLISGNCSVGFLSPLVAEFKAVGGLLIVNPYATLADIFDTWALSGQNYEPSYFTGWNFNSFAIHQGKPYGAGPDGIYLLEGTDDNGQPIHTGVRLGPHNFGTDRYKRLRALQLGNCGDNARVRVQAGEDEGYFEVDRGRVQVSRNLQGREMTLDIADFTRLDQLEIVALILARR